MAQFDFPQLHQKPKIIHHYKILQSLDFTEVRAFLFPIHHYKTSFNPRILGVDLVGSFLTRENLYYSPSQTLK